MVSHSKYPPESRNLGCQTSAYAILTFVARFVQSLGPPNIWVNYNNSLTWILRPFGDDFPYYLPRNIPKLPKKTNSKLEGLSCFRCIAPCHLSFFGFVHHRCNWDSKWPRKKRSLQPSMDWFVGENFNRKAPYFMGKSMAYMVSCKISLKPIQSNLEWDMWAIS